MSLLISFFAPVLMLLSCAGYGRMATRAFDTGADHRPPIERVSLEIAIGMGLFGWLLFFAGIAEWFAPVTIWTFTAAGLAMFVLMSKLRPARAQRDTPTRDSTKQFAALAVLLAVVLMMDIVEGIAPPADGDTLAFHAAIPKYFAEIGRIEFLPTALTGAIPLLSHLLYQSLLQIRR